LETFVFKPEQFHTILPFQGFDFVAGFWPQKRVRFKSVKENTGIIKE
jgi:hypothetical protein